MFLFFYKDCRISWVLTLNSYTIGGYGDSSSTTTDQCLNGCLRDLSCTGIQVHHLLADAVECWRFYSDSFSLSSSLIAGYDQYTLQSRCFNGTGTLLWLKKIGFNIIFLHLNFVLQTLLITQCHVLSFSFSFVSFWIALQPSFIKCIVLCGTINNLNMIPYCKIFSKSIYLIKS